MDSALIFCLLSEHELKRTSGPPALCSLQWTPGSAPVPPSLPQQPLTGKQESSKLSGAMADSHDLMSSIRSRVNGMALYCSTGLLR